MEQHGGGGERGERERERGGNHKVATLLAIVLFCLVPIFVAV